MNKKIQKIFFISILAKLLLSCFPSYSVLPKEYGNLKSLESKPKIYVVNKDLKTEFKILKNSNMYEIVDDSLKSDLKIKLYSLKNLTGWRCGNPMSGTMLTLGLLPYFENRKYIFNYEVNGKNLNKNKSDTIEIRQSLWFFNFLYPKSFNKQAGKALLGNYLNKKTNSQSESIK